ncbi:Cell division control protein 11 [Gurleya vavrai]
MRRRKSSFTFMVAGRKQIGKSTFINTLLNRNITNKPSSDINMYMLDIECEGVSKRITAIDTPGLGATFNDKNIISVITNFIKMQYDKYLAEETKVRRDPKFEDTRIHCLIYFLTPHVRGMKESDIVFLKEVCMLVNIIPVIGKADCLSEAERLQMKQNIKKQLKENQICIFDFKGYEMYGNKEELEEKVPFTLICDEERERNYKWGKAETDNAEHCDFVILREVMLSSHCESLVDNTDCEIYENYRTNVLSAMLPQEPC